MKNILDLYIKCLDTIETLSYLRRNIEDFKPYWDKRNESLINYAKKRVLDNYSNNKSYHNREIYFKNNFETIFFTKIYVNKIIGDRKIRDLQEIQIEFLNNSGEIYSSFFQRAKIFQEELKNLEKLIETGNKNKILNKYFQELPLREMIK